MRYWELPEQAAGIGRKALTLLEVNNLAPSPVNYDLWFAYAVGENRDLMRELDAAVRSGAVRDMDHARALHAKYISGANGVDQLAITLQSQIDQLSRVLATANKDTRAFGETLGNAAQELSGQDLIPHLRAIVENVASATRVMQARNDVLEQQLESSSQEVRTLNARVEAIHKETQVDDLTGLANRRGFDARLAQAVAQRAGRNSALCVLMGDVDHFKQFNEQWGHAAGDQVLRLVGQCFKSHTQDCDTVARIGGEEFVVILNDTTLDKAIAVAEEIRRSVASKKVVRRASGEMLGTITVSIGVARFEPGESTTDLIERADGCLLTA